MIMRTDDVEDGIPLRVQIWALCAWGVVLCSQGCVSPERRNGDLEASSHARRPAAVGRSEPTLEALSMTPWLEPGQRSRLFPVRYRLEDQDGRSLSPHPWLGKPFAVSFLYTRCQNSNKCPRVAFTFGELQKKMASRGLSEKAGLILMSYDPEGDSCARLKEFALDHGIQPGQSTWVVRPDPGQKLELFSDLQVAVNFNRGDVNIHGIQLFLFDARSRWVRSYHTLIWDNDRIVADLSRLAAER